MVALQISESLAGTIEKEAASRGISIEDYLRSAIRHERAMAARQKLEREQEWWLSLPLSKRAKYAGEFVAIHNQKLVDHDRNDIALYQRIRKKHGTTPILIMPAGGPREIHVYSPKLARQ